MKPGHIKVFDGLRITTEHMNHLQGSFHSALQDIRQIMGTGKVHSGFEVLAKDRRTITVQPGIAFDSRKNRVVCEEPRSLTVEWGEQGQGNPDEKYVCIEYEQVEDGIIEGEPTLIWDSCGVMVRPGMPAPEENVIAVARITRNKENGTIDVFRLPSESGEQEEGPEENDEGADGSHQWGLRIRQGVECLPGEPESEKEIDLETLILEPLKKKLNSPGNTSAGELLFTLAEKEVALDSPICSLNCHTIINVDVHTGDSGSEDSREDNIEPPMRFQAAAQGEVTVTGDRVSQFGISTSRFYPAGPGAIPWSFSGLTQHGIAHLPLGEVLTLAAGPDRWTGAEILENVQFSVKVEAGDNPGFKVICTLEWKGEITREMIDILNEKKICFIWRVVHAYKALDKNFD
jgi:hypothetical protein